VQCSTRCLDKAVLSRNSQGFLSKGFCIVIASLIYSDNREGAEGFCHSQHIAQATPQLNAGSEMSVCRREVTEITIELAKPKLSASDQVLVT
jgi:hypothetical protein